jgi:biotin carboxyl carrier protein
MPSPYHPIEVEPNVFSILLDNTVYEARRDGNIVTIAGRRYDIAQRDPRKWNPASAGIQAHGRDTVKSPMPGKIVRILVSPGDDVPAGHGVIVVEAMKMQNELKTTRAGRISSVNVKENDTVEAGATLIVVE